MKILRIEANACLFYFDQLGQNLISLLCCSTQEEQTRQLLIQCLLMPQVVLLKDLLGHVNCLEPLLDLIKDILKDMLKDLLKLIKVNCLEPLVDLLKDEAVQEKIDEVARLFYSNDTVTINLYWAAAAALLTLLREYPIHLTVTINVLYSGCTYCS